MSEVVESKFYFPALGGMCCELEPLGYPLIRFGTGAILFP
jgi:hypothetical protein